MSAPPFILLYTDEAQAIMDDLISRPRDEKTKKVRKALRFLRDLGPSYPALESHKYHSMTGPTVRMYGSPTWRIRRLRRGASGGLYGPDADTLTITTIGPHP